MRKQSDRTLTHEFIAADRWWVGVSTPTKLSIHNQADMAKEIAILNPGWGKKNTMLKGVAWALAERGIMPIIIDTRFAYFDRFDHATKPEWHPNLLSLLKQKRPRQQHYRAGESNPFFPLATQSENRYPLRRVTALAATITQLSIEQASLVGHSKGAHIAAQLATKANLRIEVPKLILVNAVGIGETGKLTNQILSNIQNNELFNGQSETFDLLKDAVPSALSSFVYGVTHARRWLREKDDIQSSFPDTWLMVDDALAAGTDVTILHAVGDRAIEIAQARKQAMLRPTARFIETPGGHSNIYTTAIEQLIAEQFSVAA